MFIFSFKPLAGLALAQAVVSGSTTEKRDFDVFDYINPLIGTNNGGKQLLNTYDYGY